MDFDSIASLSINAPINFRINFIIISVIEVSALIYFSCLPTRLNVFPNECIIIDYFLYLSFSLPSCLNVLWNDCIIIDYKLSFCLLLTYLPVCKLEWMYNYVRKICYAQGIVICLTVFSGTKEKINGSVAFLLLIFWLYCFQAPFHCAIMSFVILGSLNFNRGCEFPWNIWANK